MDRWPTIAVRRSPTTTTTRVDRLVLDFFFQEERDEFEIQAAACK